MNELYFWGCIDQPGHHLYDRSESTVRRPESHRIPSPHDLDGGPIFLPPEKVGTGALTYLPACNLTILAWWGNNPWDDRPGVNNAILIRGTFGLDRLWHEFSQAFPGVAPKLAKPVVLAVPDSGYGVTAAVRDEGKS